MDSLYQTFSGIHRLDAFIGGAVMTLMKHQYFVLSVLEDSLTGKEFLILALWNSVLAYSWYIFYLEVFRGGGLIILDMGIAFRFISPYVGVLLEQPTETYICRGWIVVSDVKCLLKSNEWLYSMQYLLHTMVKIAETWKF